MLTCGSVCAEALSTSFSKSQFGSKTAILDFFFHSRTTRQIYSHLHFTNPGPPISFPDFTENLPAKTTIVSCCQTPSLDVLDLARWVLPSG